ncbi:hypothetical protein G6F40_016110 [Rhizopus arrhizus]|nr:hypothetical protein G6F40_016110 [Rhizopus arrhizus]
MLGGAGLVVPAADSRRSQCFPREKRPRVHFALRGDIAVAHHVFRGDPVALDDVAQQDRQRPQLAFVVGVPERLAVRAVRPAGVDDFDADGRAVHGDIAARPALLIR